MAPQNAYPRLRPFDVSANPDLPGSNRIDRYTRSGVGLTYLAREIGVFYAKKKFAAVFAGEKVIK